MNVFIRMMQNPLKLRLFLFTKIPSAFFSGVRIRNISEERCVVTVPFRWYTQNPFRSTYFACQAMAAEMSTGALVMSHIYNKVPSVSMLVTGMTAEYFKKADNRTTFICKDGLAIRDAVEEAIETNGSNVITVKSIGTNPQGELISEFTFTWSLKVRKPRQSAA